MFANNQLAEWNSASGASAEFDNFPARGRFTVRVPVAEKYRFRRVYLAVWFRGDASQTSFRSELRFLKNRALISSHRFGRVSVENSFGERNLLAMPPFSVETLPTANVGPNPPMLAGGDMPRQLVVTQSSVADPEDLNTCHIRITPWETFAECDAVELETEFYISNSGTPTLAYCYAFLGVHSSVVNQ